MTSEDARESTTSESFTAAREGAPLRSFSGLEGLLAISGFPVLVTLTVGGSILAIGRGVDPNGVTGAMIFAGYTLIAVGERLVPWHRSWLHSQGDLRTDIGLLATHQRDPRWPCSRPLLLVAVAQPRGAALSERDGHGALARELAAPRTALPRALRGGARRVLVPSHDARGALAVALPRDAPQRAPPLLAERRPLPSHRSVPGGMRSRCWSPSRCSGPTLPVFALVNLFSAIHGAYQHANLPVRSVPLNWIFSMTELHRWHHSKRVEEANHNYGGNLILWDVIFGTRYLPEDRDPARGDRHRGAARLPDASGPTWPRRSAGGGWYPRRATRRAERRSRPDTRRDASGRRGVRRRTEQQPLDEPGVLLDPMAIEWVDASEAG